MAAVGARRSPNWVSAAFQQAYDQCDSRLAGSLLIYANRINAEDEAIVRVLGSAPRAHQVPTEPPLGVVR